MCLKNAHRIRFGCRRRDLHLSPAVHQSGFRDEWRRDRVLPGLTGSVGSLAGNVSSIDSSINHSSCSSAPGADGTWLVACGLLPELSGSSILFLSGSLTR